MKRILSLIASIILFTISLAAQTRAVATLSHEGQLTFFETITALEDAIAASEDGDIIYLSDGVFGNTNEEIKIEGKGITIVGNGYNSHIISQYISLQASKDRVFKFDGIRIERLKYSGLGFSVIVGTNTDICRCYITELNVGDNIIINGCKIDYFNGTGTSKVIINNSKINRFLGSRKEIVSNCNILEMYEDSPSYIENSIIAGAKGKTLSDGTYVGGGIYESCIIKDLSLIRGDKNTIRNTCHVIDDSSIDILDDDCECVLKDMDKYTGTDGSVVGIYGGQNLPFSEYPLLPSVDSSKSTVEYENGSLKVNITVAPN